MDRYYVIDPSTPEDAPVLLSLSPGAPFGMALGQMIRMPERIVATFTTLNGLQTAGWLGNIFFMAPRLVEEVKQLGERHLLEFPIVVCDEGGASINDAMTGVVTLDNIRCLDKGASKFCVSEDDHNDITEMRSLVLDESQIPSDRHLFRVAEFCTALIASQHLVDRLVAKNVRGIKFVLPKDYSV